LSYRVPFIDHVNIIGGIQGEIDFAITDTLAKGDLVLRHSCGDFEQHLADFVGVKYAIGVTVAITRYISRCSLRRWYPRDEVITVVTRLWPRCRQLSTRARTGPRGCCGRLQYGT